MIEDVGYIESNIVSEKLTVKEIIESYKGGINYINVGEGYLIKDEEVKHVL